MTMDWPIVGLAEDGVPELAAYLNDCWRETYPGVLDAGFLAGLTTEGRTDIVRRKLASGACAWIVRDPAGALAGMAMVGPSHLPGWRDAGLVGMLYVRSSLAGQGLGSRLLAVGEAELRARGYATYVLDVFTANTRAVGFYVRRGYVKVGTKVDVIEGREYGLDIMAKPAGP